MINMFTFLKIKKFGKMIKLETVLWKLFYFLISVILLKILFSLLGIDIEQKFNWSNFVFLAVPVLLLLFHSFIILSHRAIFFILLASGIGTFMENIGLRDGIFFGGHYVYKPQMTLFNVPVSVILFWAVFIYTGYCLTNSFLYWLKLKKPNFKTKNLLLLLLTILLDGYFVTAIDLFMDPIAVNEGRWMWLEKGPYFGIPIGNFIGWFIVTILATGIFRIFEYFFPKKESNITKSIYLIPVFGYGILSLTFFFMSLGINQLLSFFGLFFMLPQVILNLFLYRSYSLKNQS